MKCRKIAETRQCVFDDRTWNLRGSKNDKKHCLTGKQVIFCLKKKTNKRLNRAIQIRKVRKTLEKFANENRQIRHYINILYFKKLNIPKVFSRFKITRQSYKHVLLMEFISQSVVFAVSKKKSDTRKLSRIVKPSPARDWHVAINDTLASRFCAS